MDPEVESVTSSKSASLCCDVPKILEGTAVVDFLKPYGYFASNEIQWSQATPPELRVHIAGHSTLDGHTFYQLDCSLRSHREGDQPISWQCGMRLKQMRIGLHDLVKVQLGSSYSTYFGKVPFAHHGRPAGTTARLDAWCKRMAFCINSKLLPPLVAAAVLRLCSVPAPVPPTPASSSRSRPTKSEGYRIAAGPAARPAEIPISLEDTSTCTGDGRSETDSSSNGDKDGSDDEAKQGQHAAEAESDIRKPPQEATAMRILSDPAPPPRPEPPIILTPRDDEDESEDEEENSAQLDLDICSMLPESAGAVAANAEHSPPPDQTEQKVSSMQKRLEERRKLVDAQTVRFDNES